MIEGDDRAAPGERSRARAILEVVWGPLGGRRVIVDAGTVLRVGRADPSGLVVPGDRNMSGVHFAFGWDGASGRVTDLGSSTGTWIDGQPAAEGRVGDGSWIRAGDTVFRVHVEGAVARPAAVDRSMEGAARAAQIALVAEPLPLYAVLDAARDPRILDLLRTSACEQRSLYDGLQGQILAGVAPYLVALRNGDPLLASLVHEGWGKSWGIYLACHRPMVEVRRHLRRLLMVDMEEPAGRRRVYFRFYDPRVLGSFLPEANARQRAEMFGDVAALLFEGDGGALVRFDAQVR